MLAKRKAEPVVECHIPSKLSRVEEVLTRVSNPLMQLNEIGIKGLKWNIEQIHNAFPQRFRATCLFTEPFTGIYEVIPTGVLFFAEGTNKSICRYDIANQIINRLANKGIDQKIPLKIEAALKTELYINATSNTSTDAIRIDDSVRLLNEKICNIEYNFKLCDEGYHCSVEYKDSLFQGVASSKKLAKRDVAIQILKKHLYYTMVEDDSSLLIPEVSAVVTDTKLSPEVRRSNFALQIQNMVKNGFEKLFNSLDINDSRRKVLAGVFIGRKLVTMFPNYKEAQLQGSIDPLLFFTETGWAINADNPEEILKLVVITSGSKCLPANEMNSSGDPVNDCHAEIVAKRALQYFLHRSIDRLSKNKSSCTTNDSLYGCDILETYSAADPWTYRLKNDVKFHMYVSLSPCGDCRIPVPDINTDVLEHSNSSNCRRAPVCGLLRTKIEYGEGTIPAKKQYLNTWDKINEEARLATMSCSDKICLWNVLGMQGALLSNVLSEPIYLASITMGSLFKLDHCERAISSRVNGVTQDSSWSCKSSNTKEKENNVDLDIEQGELNMSVNTDHCFRVNYPTLSTVLDQDERCPVKGSKYSCNWILGEEKFEIISSTNGLQVDNNNPSRLSKKNLFNSFLGVFNWLPFIFPAHGIFFYGDMKRLISYPDNAIGAVNYQRKKVVLLKFFERQNLGTWCGKPIEIDCFNVKL